ncbi:DUF445 domain-containing protein [Flavobacterium sp. HSC-61S13]|uniref:DUF445 domain-containing protein n=1 Tax=Flavobacterium sp. HSC-61S13 TaxID=2910963 RepID=UPI0020A1BB09|nr:DUF445 domain-containing protein [Flavobacterium sp. HSC-61S13]MCP1995739.1 uncharacterized membrane-anchored protein YjiN (DUF445 family) [Flavobacterium sp. HSC-61S13]
MTDKKKQLRKHKRIATGLFIAMMLIYFLMVFLLKHQPQTWMNYVQAFSEAAMVGALADWFAVTALFRYPMGLKIPHTNLIENSKNSIGDNLGSFVTDNFLTSENIRPYVEKIDLALFAANWLDHSKNQDLLEKEINKILKNILINLDQATVLDFLTVKAQQGIQAIPVQNLVSQGLIYAIENNEHNRLIDLILPEAKKYVEANRDEIYHKVTEKKPILGLIGGKAVTNQLISGIVSFFDEILYNQDHKIRIELTSRLLDLTQEINSSEVWKHKFDDILEQFITPEKINTYLSELVDTLKEELLDQLSDSNSPVSKYIHNNIKQLANQLKSDESTRSKINTWVQHSVYKMILNNTQEVGNLIRNTVGNWDGKELSEKLELEVGKDLQFIRINGTLVGGLVGLIIYVVTHWIVS